MKCRVVSSLAGALAIAATSFAQSVTGPVRPDALALLRRVAQHYADAKSYHIEAIEENTTSNELQRSWQKYVLTAAEAPGNRYHYEGQTGFGSALQISDGKTIWTYRIDDHRYTEKALVTGESSDHRVIHQNEFGLERARNLRRSLGDLAGRYRSAALLPDEVLVVEGRKVSCQVVRVQPTDAKRTDPDYSSEKTFWIDKARETVVKTTEHAHSFLMTGVGRIPIEETTITTYSVRELDVEIPQTLFAFIAPPEAKLVVDFPDPSVGDLWPSLTGEAAPSLKLKSGDGKEVSLDSFRGKPVLLDVWATWCPPCVKGLPLLAQLYQDAKDKGLVFITVDTDEDAKSATDFLATKAYTWPNFHDGDGEITKSLGSSAVPRTILIDRNGKVVFDRVVYKDDELRTAVAKLDPEFASLAPKPAQNPCVASK